MKLRLPREFFRHHLALGCVDLVEIGCLANVKWALLPV
jgi:hypothetical protein